MHVDSVRNNLGGQMQVRKHLAENPRRTMVERTHRIEGVRFMPGSSFYARLSGLHVRIGMADTHAHAAPAGLGDDLKRPVEFRSNGHYPNLPSRGLPELLKCT